MSYLNSNVEQIIENEPVIKMSLQCYALTQGITYAQSLTSLSSNIDTEGLNEENPDDYEVAVRIKINAVNHIKSYFGIE